MPSPSGVPEPPWQLKGFAKLQLARGHSRRVSFALNARSFSYWSTAAGGWRIARGCDTIAVGSSSRDLPLRGVIGVHALTLSSSCPRHLHVRSALRSLHTP
jgi:beta-glucosidase